ncbi:hypothetical protein M3Y97_00257400 [Aphelenchoides bicaudatus]|nr:hypothetical protein M3Y97_00257400 [Aphelenchoides bicaudatus]
MKKSAKVLVPFTEAEWHFVKTNIMSNDVDLLEQVFGMLCITGSNTPIFIHMSKLVVQAILYDLRHCSDVSDRSNEFNAASIYGLSLTRFINYVNEIAQPKTGYLLSIANAVKEYGIPERIVHIRQHVVHGEMPSFFDLREAVQYCRDWIWEMNWKYEMAIAICDPRIVPKPTTSAENTETDFMQLFAQIWAYGSKKTNDEGEKAALQRKAKAVADIIADQISDRLDDVFIAFSNSLALSKDTFNSVQSQLQLADFEENKAEWSISEPLFEVWRPVIEIFSRGRYGLLISHLSTAVCDEIRPIDDRHQIVAWFRCIVDKIKLTDYCLSVKDLNATAHNIINAEKFFTFVDFNKCLDLFGEETERKSFFPTKMEAKKTVCTC